VSNLSTDVIGVSAIVLACFVPPAMADVTVSSRVDHRAGVVAAASGPAAGSTTMPFDPVRHQAFVEELWRDHLEADFEPGSSGLTLKLESGVIDEAVIPPDWVEHFESGGWDVSRRWSMQAVGVKKVVSETIVEERCRVSLSVPLDTERLRAAGISSLVLSVVSVVSTNGAGDQRHLVGVVSEYRLQDGSAFATFVPRLEATSDEESGGVAHALARAFGSEIHGVDYPPTMPPGEAACAQQYWICRDANNLALGLCRTAAAVMTAACMQACPLLGDRSQCLNQCYAMGAAADQACVTMWWVGLGLCDDALRRCIANQNR
jgi:hypothetical protein